MKKSKKSQVFILIALAIASILVISFGTYSYTNDRSAINQRINTMNSFLSSSEQDLSRQMYIAAYRTIFVAETNIWERGCVLHYSGDEKGECIEEDNPLEILLNETFFDESALDEEDWMFGVRRIDLFESMNENSQKLNIHIETCPAIVASPPETPSPFECGYELFVDQVDSWHIRIRFEFNLSMTDNSELASWDKRENVEVLIPIANFYDPLYIRETSDYGVKIAKANVPNIENMSSGYYYNNTDAPSFLDRVNGNASAKSSCCGIERLIDKSQLPNAGDLRARDFPVVDHLYFSRDAGDGTRCSVPGKPSWFILDKEHADLYGVAC